ncbi:DNA-binding protein RFXANK-like isoform X1 [Daphnia pulicaria]|uniref:DNA-binding protein RFXANK-like isoform X1 n=1 Tax=Daphnia pulicaria TaxID=35523 RepID=UPI001EEC79F3|nr:DNA-binding protein RFXANK-like isoform X1 [Daphnia pulicaria]
MDVPGSSSGSSSKRGRKLRQCSGDSTKSDRTEASSESDFDPNGSFQKGESSRRRCERQKQSGLKFAALAYESNYDDGEHKSAFLPYRVTPRTVLTNLQRGNVQTEAVVVNPVQLSFHQRAGKGEITKADIDAGTNDINGLDERGLTPLMWSSAYGQVPTAALLLKAGAIHSIKGPDGETAIHLAAAGGHTDIIRLLIGAGASVNEIDDNSNTPMMFAAFGNHPHALNELLNNGGDITMTNLNDDSALSIAVKRSSKEAQSVIEGYLFMLLQPQN